MCVVCLDDEQESLGVFGVLIHGEEKGRCGWVKRVHPHEVWVKRVRPHPRRVWVEWICPHPGENGHMEMNMHLMVAVLEVSGLTAFHEDVGYLRDLIDAEM